MFQHYIICFFCPLNQPRCAGWDAAAMSTDTCVDLSGIARQNQSYQCWGSEALRDALNRRLALTRCPSLVRCPLLALWTAPPLEYDGAKVRYLSSRRVRTTYVP
jgi:hypothetical protein